MATSRASLFTNPTHYLKSLNVFLKKSNDQQATRKWLQEELPDVLKEAAQIEAETFNILGVGSGKGDGDLAILEAVANYSLSKSRKPVLFNQVIEPHRDTLATFQESAQIWKEQHENVKVNFDFLSKTWQDYQTETKHEPRKFHLISFVNSIYYMEPEETLRDCLENRLLENGFLLCFALSEDMFLVRLARKFEDLMMKPEGVTYNDCSSHFLVQIAQKFGWRHQHVFFDVNLDATDVFDESSEEGNLLLDFFTRTVNFRAVTEKAKVEEFLQFWKEESILCSDGKRMMYGKVGVVIIFKK